MALTLLEAAKLDSGNALRTGIIELYTGSSDVLRVLPFDNINGNALSYNREEKLPGVGFRGVNESYTESTGVLNPQTESLVIAGGDLDVDKFIVDTMGQDQRAVHEGMKVRALSLAWTKKFIKGDADSDPREFDGLQKRITGAQLISNGSSSGGDALSLYNLDRLIDQVINPTHLLMNKTMRRRLTQAARTTGIAGFIQYRADEFGRQVAYYNDLPILMVDLDESQNAILPFTEANPGGGTAASTSIYCLSLGDGMLTGIQGNMPDVRDLGELQTKPALRTRVEWYCGIAAFNGRAAARLNGIKDAAVVA
jgi:hypothetical protein